MNQNRTDKNAEHVSVLKLVALSAVVHTYTRILETPLTNCEISLLLTGSDSRMITKANQKRASKFARTDTILYVTVFLL